jgi:hypothetical protein
MKKNNMASMVWKISSVLTFLVFRESETGIRANTIVEINSHPAMK